MVLGILERNLDCWDTFKSERHGLVSPFFVILLAIVTGPSLQLHSGRKVSLLYPAVKRLWSSGLIESAAR